MTRRENDGGAVVAPQRYPLKRGTSHLPDFNPYHTDVIEDPAKVAQVEYKGMSLRGIYAASCDAYGYRKNTSLLKILPATVETSGELIALNLSLNFVGKLGIRPILEVIQNASNLEEINFSDNFLDNSSVSELVATLDGRTQIKSVDLSKNPISQSGGKLINSLVRNNSNILHVGVAETLINPALRASILQKVDRNRDLSTEERSLRFKQQAALRGNYHQQQTKRLQRIHGSHSSGVNLDVLMALANELVCCFLVVFTCESIIIN